MHRNEGENMTSGALFPTSPPYGVLTPEFMNAVQEEIMNVVEAFGLPALSKYNDTRDQLLTAINGLSSIPIGGIIAWLPGYFTNGSNAGFTTITSIALPNIWKECDGSECIDLDSPIFNIAGRYLPNLTDDRFLMGDVSGSAGGIGGSNTQTHSVPAHYHGMGTGADLNITASGSHSHNINLSNNPPGSGFITARGVADDGQDTTSNTATHSHAAGDFAGSIGLVTGGVNGNAAMTSGSSENRPLYLSVRYIIRIK